MNRTSAPYGSPGRRFVLGLTAVCVFLGAGCQELSDRRKIQQGNKLYDEGRYSQAIDLYESALETSPHLDIGHHNLGLAYFRLFRPGSRQPKNVAYATKAAQHLGIYLQDNPNDNKIIGLMTRIWMDSGQYKKALAYWKKELDEDPKSVEVIQILASINRQAGKWEKAVEWHHKQAAAEASTDGKVEAYLSIAKLVWHKLANPTRLLGLERIRVADMGLHALQKAAALAPDHADTHTYLASIYHFRALTHGTAWARNVDEASAQFHRAIAAKLRKAAEEQQKQQTPGGKDAKGSDQKANDPQAKTVEKGR